MARLVASVSGVVLSGVVEVVGSNLARGKMFTASIGSVDSLYPSVYIYILHSGFECEICFKANAYQIQITYSIDNNVLTQFCTC